MPNVSRRTPIVCAVLALAACRAAPADAPSAADSRAPSVAEDAGELAPCAFLAGVWRTADGSAEEHWTPPRAGSMLGCGRTVQDGRTVFFEFLRLSAEDGEVVYHASPVGLPSTPFTLVHSEDGLVVFENLEHDFPQRVVYLLRADGTLQARVESDDGARGSDFFYVRG